MVPLKSSEIYGNWATLLLPLNSDESIDYSRLTEEIDIIISMQVSGIYSNGTAGEFYSQTENEFDKINLLLAEKCESAKIPFQIGCSHTNPIVSLERVKRSVALKPSAIQIILPDWYPPNINEVISYLERMAAAARPIGLVLYNPPNVKRKLLPEEYYRIIIKEYIPLVGCKIGDRGNQWYEKMEALVPNLSLFIPGHTLASGIKSGANGSYSNVACLNPKIAQNWYEMMSIDMEGALELEKRIQLFINNYILPYTTEKKFSSQAIDKFLSSIGEWANVGTRIRWPYIGIDKSEVEPMRKVCKKILPEFFNTSKCGRK